MKKWDFPEELLRLQEEPQVIRRRTEEEAALAAVSKELQRQHAAIQAILELPVVQDVFGAQDRVEKYRTEGFDWSAARPGRAFWVLPREGSDRVRFYIGAVEGEPGTPEFRIKAWSREGFVNAEMKVGAEEFIARFDGWVE